LRDIKSQVSNATCTITTDNGARNLIINPAKPPFDNPELRRALSLTLAAIARQTLGLRDLSGWIWFARLFAGGEWIRNFSSALPSVVSRVSEMLDPGRAPPFAAKSSSQWTLRWLSTSVPAAARSAAHSNPVPSRRSRSTGTEFS
jgi:hypothetical protein